MVGGQYSLEERAIKRHPELAKDLKQLGKKYPSVGQDLVYVERLLAIGHSFPHTDAYKGFGARRLFKTRVENTSVSRGKSKGYRLIYEVVVEEDDEGCELLLLYDHNAFKAELDVRKELRARLGL